MLKKLLCLLLALGMLFSFAACSDNGGHESDDNHGGQNDNDPGSNSSDPTEPEDDTVWVLVQESDMFSDRYTKYIYDENGELVGGEYYKGLEKWGDYQFVATKNADGTKAVEQWYKHVGDSEFTMQRVLTFDAEGRLIRNQAYDNGEPETYFTTFTYNAQGQLVEQVYTKDGEMYEKLIFAYDGDKLTEGHYEDKNGYYGHYIYTYDENGDPLKVDVHTDYADEQQYTLEFKLDTMHAYEIRATEDCHNVVGGRRLFLYNENAEYCEILIKNWGIFHTGWLPLVSFGCLDSGNYFNSSATLKYEPLEVHLAKQAESE